MDPHMVRFSQLNHSCPQQFACLQQLTSRIMAGVPVLGLFSLFELVIFNPTHHGVRENLTLLDVAGGYFSQLEYASGGSLQASLVSEFAYIAREYVNSLQAPEILANETDGRSNAGPPEPRSAAEVPQESSSMEQEISGAINTRNQHERLVMESVAASREPNFTVGMESTMSNSAASLALGNPTSMPTDGLDFPMNEMFWDINTDLTLGTDIMDLFVYSMPDIDTENT